MGKQLTFRTLKADEIECRVASVKNNGLTLLLYKDARCDMNLLDETVGAMNWKRDHKVVKESLFCEISIYNEETGQWVTKSDCGVESYAEKQKGEASDSFKRAGFNWGIGRELYTAPFIWVASDKCNIQNGKCFDTFAVSEISYDETRHINYLVIINSKTKKVVYTYGSKAKTSSKPKADSNNNKEDRIKAIRELINKAGKDENDMFASYSKKQGKDVNINTMSEEDYNILTKALIMITNNKIGA